MGVGKQTKKRLLWLLKGGCLSVMWAASSMYVCMRVNMCVHVCICVYLLCVLAGLWRWAEGSLCVDFERKSSQLCPVYSLLVADFLWLFAFLILVLDRPSHLGL